MMIETNRIAGSNRQYTRFRFHDFVLAQKELGIEKIDLAGVVPHLWCDHLEPINTTEIRKELKQANLSVAAFTPKAYKYSICAETGTVQAAATLDYYRNCIAAAKELKCDTVVITAEGGCFDRPYEELWKNASEMLKALSDDAVKKEITLVLPSSLKDDAPILTTLNEVQKMLSEVHSEAFCAMVDVNAVSLCGETITQWFKKLGNRIKLVRFTDGNYNGYRAWGEGCLPCERFLSELEHTGYLGILSLQMPGERYLQNPFEADDKNLRALRKYLK